MKPFDLELAKKGEKERERDKGLCQNKLLGSTRIVWEEEQK
jgi:hypothetical protein